MFPQATGEPGDCGHGRDYGHLAGSLLVQNEHTGTAPTNRYVGRPQYLHFVFVPAVSLSSFFEA